MPFYEEENRAVFFRLLAYSFTFCNRKERHEMLENKFQSNLIKEIKDTFPGCIVMKNDSSYIQGIPDLLVLHNDKWASLEVKKSRRASKRPNQEYYVDRMDQMSFARFIYPENKDEVMRSLHSHFSNDIMEVLHANSI